MKRIILLTLIFNILTMTAQKEQFFTTSFEKNGYIDITSSKLEKNIFSIEARVKWVNDNLRELKNDPSVLVFVKDSFVYNDSEYIKLLGFEDKNHIGFHDSLVLNFAVSEEYKGGIINIDIPFYYAENQYLEKLEGNIYNFQFTSPRDIAFNYTIRHEDIKDFTPPQLAILSPVDSEGKPMINSNKVVVVVEATDLLGVKNVKINNVEATHQGNNQYTAELTLKTGDNLLVVRAADEQGNTSREEILVESTYYQPIKIEEGEYYALIIGINDYEDEDIDDLDNALSDANLLYQTLLDEYTFKPENLTLLKNPKRADIIVSLDEISQYVGEGDNLLLFYAGHGYYDEQKDLGYWLPSDATKTNTANWIGNSTIRDYIKSIKSKHTLLIADACFSGSIFKTRGLEGPPKAINRLYDLPSRKAITSGTLTTVPDKSVFIKYFVSRLEQNDEKYLTSEKLFASFKEAIINNSSTIPQYGTIQNAGDEGGDFIFIKK